MNFSGTEHFHAPIEIVFDKVTNLELTAKMLPGLDRVEKLEPTHLECRVKPTFSFLSGTMQMVFDLLEVNRPSMARMRVTGKNIGGSLVIETSVHLSQEEAATRLDWTSQVVESKGLIKALSRTLIEGAAKKIVTDSWASFRKELG